MKTILFTCSLFLLSMLPLFCPAGDPEFYNDYNSALKISKQELRALKILEMLDKYPDRAEKLQQFFGETMYKLKVTPAISGKAAGVLKNHPENLMVNIAIRPYFPFDPQRDVTAIRRLLLNCKIRKLSDTGEYAVIFFISLLARHYHDQEISHTETAFFDRVFQRMNSLDSTAKFKYYLLTNALDFYRQAIWEKECSFPAAASWKKLPMRGAKLRYHQYFEQLTGLEKEFEFPFSMNLLNHYIFFHPDRAARYISERHFSETAHTQFAGFILAAAMVSGKPELFEPYLPKLQTLKKNPLTIRAAVAYALKFKRFELLEKVISPDEAELVKMLAFKDFTRAAAVARKILKSGKITLSDSVNHITAIIWNTKDRPLLAELWKTAEKNPELLLKPEQANSIAYAAAVLDLDLDKAEKLALTAVKKQPNYAILDTYAYILYRQKKYAAAHRFITLAIKDVNPGDSCAPIYLHAAEIELAHTGNKSRARYFAAQRPRRSLVRPGGAPGHPAGKKHC